MQRIEAIVHVPSPSSVILGPSPEARIIDRLHLQAFGDTIVRLVAKAEAKSVVVHGDRFMPEHGSLDLALAGYIPPGYGLHLEVGAPVSVCGSIAVSVIAGP